MEKLNDLFFYNLEKTVKTYRRFISNQLKTNGLEITLDQWLILRAVSENPDITQNDIADMVFKDKASVTRIIELLVQNGFLTRDFHATNRRMVQLSITVKGNQTIETLSQMLNSIRAVALNDILTDDKKTTQQVLQKIIANCQNQLSNEE